MSVGIVFDASVIINILRSGQEERILGALPGRRVVVEVTWISLPEASLVRFIELTGAAPPDDLDDGEAAALAAGETLALPVAVDEAKGRRVARARLRDVQLLSSAEVFAMPEVAATLGAQLGDALFSALVNARMRVLPDHEAWVRELLGQARVAQCPSLRRRRT